MTIDITLISALTALLAVIVGPVISIYIAKRQIRASVVSTNRQKWIDSLRDQLATLIADIRIVGLHRKLDLLENDEYDTRLQRLLLVEIKVNLLLNPNEADHNSLSKLLRKVIEAIFNGDETVKRQTTNELLPEIVRQTQDILKREWERVKASD